MTRSFEVLVIGAGASGIGAAIRLKRDGIDFAVLEKADSFGGTWRANTYPGCACDVPSALYSYSFAPNPLWSRAYGTQPEIRAYLTRTADEHGIAAHTRFGVEMTGAQWDPDAGRWRVETTDGQYDARFLVTASGPWNEPLVPEIPGLADFPGEVFHSARWNHGYDLTGKRVAVVGTGASAVQFVPEIAARTARLHLFQRTAQWVLPKPDHRVSGFAQGLLRRFPLARRVVRAGQYAVLETLGVGFRVPRLMRLVQALGRAHLRLTVRDRALRAKLTPDYTIGCKRLLFSNSYYQTLAKSTVDVHACAVAEVRGSTVVGADGDGAEVDAIIFATGFHILDSPLRELVRDAHGRALDDHWKGSPQSYLGTVVSGFPNLFLLLGPNLGTGHSSAFAVLEAQLDYTLAAIAHARAANWTSMRVRAEVQAAYNADVQRALAGTVYNTGGCASYYFDANGRNSFSWPWSTSRLRSRVGAFDPRAFVAD
ncbi:flavin-containing monooxygenase [Actinokineospora iranica]|uniref:Predicted flavoprotein CzcO associated with the cation diffusion facilitator CzcD n=1 Tax=Actinokineospora iranica TaxID=1271860 RepID=A0A1G6LGN5_9PSEU|nr:NAD(P)/FAD-dependent oxidoreductase [Actinokineospora iranica]SDC41915.1 Predicted flavoprotein CzcO associated with the cation diffusion facilitator CzcD [Actinokineospora iranica]